MGGTMIRRVRNWCFLAAVILTGMTMLQADSADAQVPNTMEFQEVIVHWPNGQQEVCYKCDDFGNECEDPYHETFCNDY